MITVFQTGSMFRPALPAGRVFVQTKKHPFMTGCDDAESMDDIYDSTEDFDELNENIAKRLVKAAEDGDVSYMTLGRINPDVLKAIRALKGGVELKLMPFAGFAESAYSAAVSKGLLDGETLFTECPANRLTGVADTEALNIITEIDSPLAAGEVKLTLSEYFPDEYGVFFASPDSTGEYEVIKIKLFELDRLKKYDAASSLIVPPKRDLELPRHSVEGLMQLMRRLRAPGGCPWDAEQTHESLKKTLLEECYEVIDAIDRKAPDELCEELGDLLMQIAFHVVIEEEHASFTLRDVATGITNKMIFRHPHVFGSVHVENSDEVLTNWEILKKEEKHQRSVSDAMDSVPKSFPPLLRAYKIQKKAADVGFDFSSAQEALPKVHEEADEVMEALGENDAEHLADEIGDLLFAVVNVARLRKIDPDLALTEATDKFERRFKLTERLILEDGKSFGDMTLPEMDVYWERAKKVLKETKQ